MSEALEDLLRVMQEESRVDLLAVQRRFPKLKAKELEQNIGQLLKAKKIVATPTGYRVERRYVAW